MKCNLCLLKWKNRKYITDNVHTYIHTYGVLLRTCQMWDYGCLRIVCKHTHTHTHTHTWHLFLHVHSIMSFCAYLLLSPYQMKIVPAKDVAWFDQTYDGNHCLVRSHRNSNPSSKYFIQVEIAHYTIFYSIRPGNMQNLFTPSVLVLSLLFHCDCKFNLWKTFLWIAWFLLNWSANYVNFKFTPRATIEIVVIRLADLLVYWKTDLLRWHCRTTSYYLCWVFFWYDVRQKNFNFILSATIVHGIQRKEARYEYICMCPYIRTSRPTDIFGNGQKFL